MQGLACSSHAMKPKRGIVYKEYQTHGALDNLPSCSQKAMCMDGVKWVVCWEPVLVVQARVNLPDERFNWLKNLYKPKSEIPAYLEVVDIAGLVKGASDGQGLGMFE